MQKRPTGVSAHENQRPSIFLLYGAYIRPVHSTDFYFLRAHNRDDTVAEFAIWQAARVADLVPFGFDELPWAQTAQDLGRRSRDLENSLNRGKLPNQRSIFDAAKHRLQTRGKIIQRFSTIDQHCLPILSAASVYRIAGFLAYTTAKHTGWISQAREVG